jgi:hypothetical protein
MSRLSQISGVLVALAAVASAPGHATIVGVAPGADFSNGNDYTIDLLGGSASYTFSAIPLDGNDTLYRTAAIQTTGSATGYGGGFIGNGTDYTSYSAGSATPGNNFGGDFIGADTPRAVDYSLADTYVALRFGDAASYYYGYAEIAGDTLVRFAYNDVANGSITTGQAIEAPISSAVPEPASWATMIAGVGLIGAAMRRTAKRPKLATT